MVVEIPLTKGYVTLVDDEVAELVQTMKWCAHGRGGLVYAQGRRYLVDGRERRLLLHRWLIDAPPGLLVDHINRNSLDNRRSNLRVATPSQNQGNSPPRSGRYKGVSFRKRERKWVANIMMNGRLKELGTFRDEEDAALAYDAAAIQVFGEFAWLNFPEVLGVPVYEANHNVNLYRLGPKES